MLPTGTVTFLFTDIQGSTPLWERAPEQMAEALQANNSALRLAIESNGGVVFKIVGDNHLGNKELLRRCLEHVIPSLPDEESPATLLARHSLRDPSIPTKKVGETKPMTLR